MSVRIADIQVRVAREFGIPPETMTGHSLARKFSKPRQIAMYLARKLTDQSLPQIGRQFGYRDHTTVLHACRAVDGLRMRDDQMRARIAWVADELASGEWEKCNAAFLAEMQVQAALAGAL